MRVIRKNRVGIDIDSNNMFNLLKTYFNAKRFGEVGVYKTNGGFHIHINMPNRTKPMNLHIRRILGDCKNRLIIDEQKYLLGMEIEFLFRYKAYFDKNGRIKYESVEELFNPLSEPFWSVRNH